MKEEEDRRVGRVGQEFGQALELLLGLGQLSLAGVGDAAEVTGQGLGALLGVEFGGQGTGLSQATAADEELT